MCSYSLPTLQLVITIQWAAAVAQAAAAEAAAGPIQPQETFLEQLLPLLDQLHDTQKVSFESNFRSHNQRIQ